ncbi:hypothetical protein J8F10_29810 [Gemmata sp. G18]|uniref:Lipoprotein n=1 Tax=Gemmata palustris TaxID=2822762 RepID=A0ABS5C0E1_9BACT|nr:hypothetical protein [Gemmata palustris]MBP3959461.1 hypothetical protein [Gemmata palustris]
MRRYIALTSVLAALVAALGCSHVGGKCDCGYNPSDYQITGPTNPYPSAPAPAVPAKPTPPKGGGNE